MKKLLSPLLLIFLFSNCNNTPDIIVIGHRGAMGHALENTITSGVLLQFEKRNINSNDDNNFFIYFWQGN